MRQNSTHIPPTRMAPRDAVPLPRPTGTAPHALHALQRDVLEAVASSQPLDRIIQLLCRRVAQLAPAAVCSVLGVDAAGRLHTIAGPDLPEGCARVLDGACLDLIVGPPGGDSQAQVVTVYDVDTDPRWAPFRTALLAAGLRGCWPSPIIGRDGGAVGAVAFYYSARRAPSTVEQRVMEASLHLCALAIEHDRVCSRLAQTNHGFDVALSNMSQGVCFFDGDGKLIVANRRYSEIYGLPAASIVPGISSQEIVDLRIRVGSGPKMPKEAYAKWQAGLKLSNLPSDSAIELANGKVIAVHYQPMPDRGWVATHEDITERLRVEAQVVHMARHDPLTGLPNRLVFHERVEQALATAGRGQQSAILCLNLDHFKAINDTFGHAVGDALLQAVGDRLQACAREVDTVTRLAGDEFAVLLVGLEQADSAVELARRIVRTLADAFNLDGHSIVLSASVGIAIAPQDGRTPSKLLKSAATALYRAKLDERGTHRFFEPEMDARLQARSALARDLRQAMLSHEFELAYQPVFNVASNAICSFEALLRWRHPVRGMVSPAEFIPMAEETGMISPIGAWVLQQACAEASNWPASVKIAVNLSAVQFKNKTLVDTVSQALAAAGLPASRLDLEITETMLLKNSAATLATLHELRDLGAGISMDDFGTGYSSLSYLRSFPFDKIKIDQSFIRDLSDRPESIAIVRAIISLGRSLGMTTTAEGVETQYQLEQLRQEGCTEVQGYLFSRPTTAANVRLMLSAGVANASPALVLAHAGA